jgi:hypothetical protein
LHKVKSTGNIKRPMDGRLIGIEGFNSPLTISVPVGLKHKVLESNTSLFHRFSVTINTYLRPVHPLMKCGHQCLERNVTQNLNHHLKKLFGSLKFCYLDHSFYMTEEKKSIGTGPPGISGCRPLSRQFSSRYCFTLFATCGLALPACITNFCRSLASRRTPISGRMGSIEY